ncbi:MAG: glycine cleavage system aminomethyltransferase GcvT [Candidatus Bathyarchaeia archaeon]
MALKTQLYDYHEKNGKLIEFVGFSLPVWYKGIIPECMATRTSLGIFDVSHMGRVSISGEEAENFLNYVITNDLSPLSDYKALYSVMCNENGGIIDDLTVVRLGKNSFLLIYNASNRKKDFSWLKQNSSKFKVELEDISDRVAMIALQGSNAQATLEGLCGEDLSKVARFGASEISIEGNKCLISRTGYTGEDGFEIFVYDAPVENPWRASKVWNSILEAGKEFGISPCGLGARDVLRLEAGMCLYGNDIDESTTPLEARLKFVVKFDKTEFIGKAALAKQMEEGIEKVRVGLMLLERGIPRAGYDIVVDGQLVGKVTSGTASPTLNRGIAMGYVQKDYSKEETHLGIRIRERLVKAKVVKLPFYQRRVRDKIIYLGNEYPFSKWKELGLNLTP